jgi:hypothetical protein
MYNSILRALTVVYDSWTQSRFLDIVHRLKKKTGFGSQLCFRLQVKKHLTQWIPEIELFSVIGYFINAQLLNICIWEQIKPRAVTRIYFLIVEVVCCFSVALFL